MFCTKCGVSMDGIMTVLLFAMRNRDGERA